MKHARQSIREAVEALLAVIPVITVAPSKLTRNVTRPAVTVYGSDEQIGQDGSDRLVGSRVLQRYLDLTIAVVVDTDPGYEDLADDFAAQIEVAMAADPTLGGLVLDSQLQATQDDLEPNDATPLAELRLIYRVWYRTRETDPETTL